MSEKRYKANRLLDLMFEIAENSASGPDRVSATHLLYACTEILLMPRPELLAEVGGAQERNSRVLGSLTVAEENLNEKQSDGRQVNIQALNELLRAYLPEVERRGIGCYRRLFMEIIQGEYQEKASLSGEEIADILTFAWVPQILFSLHGVSDYVKQREGSGKPLSLEEQDQLAASVLFHTEVFRSISMNPGAQLASTNLRKESGEKVAERAEKLKNALERTVFGQDYAVKAFLDAYKKACYFKNREGKPLAVYLLAGPPGTGKTLLAETAAKALGMPYKRIDMSEYGGDSKDTVQGLVGFERSWRNAEPGLLTSYVESHPDALLLFDEIEKASEAVLKIFLQILEGARLTDKYTKRTVSFEKTILIFTTNAGRELYQDNYDENLSVLPGDTVADALRKDKSFPQELVSRFASNTIIMFNHVSKLSLMKIALRAMEHMLEGLDRSVWLCGRPELLLLLHEGAKLDARMAKSRAEDMISQALVEYMDFESAQEMPGHDPITLRVSEEDAGSEAGRYLFPCADNPIYIRYISEQSCYSELDFLWELFDAPDDLDDWYYSPEEQRMRLADYYDEIGALREHYREFCAECSWLKLACSFFYEYDLDEMEEKEFMDLHERDHYDITVVDLGNRSRKSPGLPEEDPQENEFLQAILKNPGRNHIYAAFDGELDEQLARRLFRQGVEGILPRHPDDAWTELASTYYALRSLDQLSQEGKVLDYQTEVSERSIVFTDFVLRKANVEDAATRKRNQDLLLSDWERPKDRFSDVIGAENAVRELRQFIQYINKPEYYEMMGLDMPKGVLLYGPPGTGKTKLARAAAGESGVSFLAVSASDFMQQYIGTGEQKIRDLFAAAKQNSPAIVFIDEIDTIGKERTGSEFTQHTEKLLNTLLTEMDGFASLRKKQVFVMAATNFDIDGTKSGKRVRIDPALVRRFPTQIYVDLPSRDERAAFIRMRLEKRAEKTGLIETAQIGSMAESLADQTVGQSLAIVENLLEYAWRQFVMNLDGVSKKKKFTEAMLLEAVQEMRFGERSAAPETATAYHEAAHAFMAWKMGETPAFLTIVSRSGFGGYVQERESGRSVHTEKSLRSQIKISLAGRAGEMIFYKYYAENASDAELLKEAINTGAGSDLEHATWYARQIVSGLGRTSDSLARIPENQRTAEMDRELFEELNLILKVEWDRTLQIVEENHELVHRLALKAIDKTQLTQPQILDILEAESLE